jgi:hypothetical protein
MESGMNGRHRDNDGEISRKHGNSESAKLSDVLADLKEDSLQPALQDHGAGHLEEKVRTAALD